MRYTTILFSLMILVSQTFAGDAMLSHQTNHEIQQEKMLLQNDPTYAWHLALKATAPDSYIVLDHERQARQLRDIEGLLLEQIGLEKNSLAVLNKIKQKLESQSHA